MPLLDITRPEVIKFLVENYDKTTRLRIKWNSLHSDRLKSAATLPTSAKGYFEEDVLKEEITMGMATVTRDFASAGCNKRRKALRDGTHVPATGDLSKDHSIPYVGLGDPNDDPRLSRPDDDLTFDPVMRPIAPEEKKILYKDLPTYGRVAYLKSRNKKLPEQKYYFAEATEWQYGFRQEDSYFKRNVPTWGKVFRLTRDRSRTGPQPDPHHYKSSGVTGPVKCL